MGWNFRVDGQQNSHKRKNYTIKQFVKVADCATAHQFVNRAHCDRRMDGDRVKKRSIDELGGSGEKQHKKSKTVADTSGLKQEGKAAQSRPKPRAIKPSSLWNFAVDYNDHFETPSVAYADIAPFLHTMSSALQISEDRLTIFDPYWCEGSVVANLNELGFKSVINRNRDFYADIKKRAIPGQYETGGHFLLP